MSFLFVKREPDSSLDHSGTHFNQAPITKGHPASTKASSHCQPKDWTQSQAASLRWGSFVLGLNWFLLLTIWASWFFVPLPTLKFTLLCFKFTNKEWACKTQGLHPSPIKVTTQARAEGCPAIVIRTTRFGSAGTLV